MSQRDIKQDFKRENGFAFILAIFLGIAVSFISIPDIAHAGQRGLKAVSGSSHSSRRNRGMRASPRRGMRTIAGNSRHNRNAMRTRNVRRSGVHFGRPANVRSYSRPLRRSDNWNGRRSGRRLGRTRTTVPALNGGRYQGVQPYSQQTRKRRVTSNNRGFRTFGDGQRSKRYIDARHPDIEYVNRKSSRKSYRRSGQNIDRNRRDRGGAFYSNNRIRGVRSNTRRLNHYTRSGVRYANRDNRQYMDARQQPNTQEIYLDNSRQAIIAPRPSSNYGEAPVYSSTNNGYDSDGYYYSKNYQYCPTGFTCTESGSISRGAKLITLDENGVPSDNGKPNRAGGPEIIRLEDALND